MKDDMIEAVIRKMMLDLDRIEGDLNDDAKEVARVAIVNLMRLLGAQRGQDVEV